MPSLRPTEPELLPGADPETDCQTPASETALATGQPELIDEEADEPEHSVTWGTLADTESSAPLESWRMPRSSWSVLLEKLALAVERPVNRLTGSAQLNPFYHTGTIAVFLLIVVGLTGLYLFFFFQYGFDDSYNAVARMNSQLIARTIRSIHRYASGALVITTLLHAFRTLFLEQFHGPRWLAWVTGVVMTAILWLAGVTGYWLIWDERAQLITDSFTRFLDRFSPAAGRAFSTLLVGAAATERSWPILLIMLGIHVLLFAVSAIFFWLHVRRLSRPKWLPNAYWASGMTIVLLIGSLIFPVGMLAQANALRLPEQVNLDPVFLFYLPTSGTTAGLALWGFLLVATVAATALPWLLPKKKATAQVNIIKDRCTGCTKCALDCPYQAITMVERHDGKPHKFIAIEDPGLCVGCGICVGSCDGVAVTLDNTPPEILWQTVSTQLALAQAKYPDEPLKVIFTCDRHAQHGAKPYLPGGGLAGSLPAEVIALPCVGTAPPDLLTRTLDAGAAEVQVVGCPPDDCANREGNLWTEKRLTRERVPRLRRAYANAPITAAWVPPNAFGQALALDLPVVAGPEPTADEKEIDYLASREMKRPVRWQQVVPAFVLLGLALLLQIFLTDLPFQPYPDRPAVVEVALPVPAEPFASLVPNPGESDSFQVRLTVDDQTLLDQSYQAADLMNPDLAPIHFKQQIAPGEYHVQLGFTSDKTGETFPLYDKSTTIDPGQILLLTHETINLRQLTGQFVDTFLNKMAAFYQSEPE